MSPKQEFVLTQNCEKQHGEPETRARHQGQDCCTFSLIQPGLGHTAAGLRRVTGASRNQPLPWQDDLHVRDKTGQGRALQVPEPLQRSKVTPFPPSHQARVPGQPRPGLTEADDQKQPWWHLDPRSGVSLPPRDSGSIEGGWQGAFPSLNQLSQFRTRRPGATTPQPRVQRLPKTFPCPGSLTTPAAFAPGIVTGSHQLPQRPHTLTSGPHSPVPHLVTPENLAPVSHLFLPTPLLLPLPFQKFILYPFIPQKFTLTPEQASL